MKQVSVLLLFLMSGLMAAQSAADSNPNDPERQRALELYDQHKMPEAAALLEKVVARYPKDVVAHERLGVALLSRSSSLTDPEKEKAERIHARAELLRAKELGDTSDLCKILLEQLPEDGSKRAFSTKAAVDEAMNRGEAAFGKGDWQEALKEYSRAYELDPGLYIAAVDLGDTYFRLNENGKAGEWYARAIEIDPNQEVAYRYWGDALLADGKMKEAREKFIQALVAYPYRQSSWAGLNNWLRRNQAKFKEIPIKVPEGPKTGPKGETVITVDPSQPSSSVTAAWMIYPMERSLWQKEKFAKAYPQEKTYRHSLQEEVAALSLSTKVYEETQTKKKDNPPDPGLTLLSKFKAEGLLEPYVLLLRVDQGIAQDYSGYRDAHRGKLVEFVDKYVMPPAP